MRFKFLINFVYLDLIAFGSLENIYNMIAKCGWMESCERGMSPIAFRNLRIPIPIPIVHTIPSDYDFVFTALVDTNNRFLYRLFLYHHTFFFISG